MRSRCGSPSCPLRSACSDCSRPSCWCGACAVISAADVLEVSIVRQLAGFRLDATFTAPTPGIIALFGRSGSGKSTLTNIIAGLLAPDAGAIRLDGEVLSDARIGISTPVERRRIGYLFQDAHLFPHLSVA